MTPFVKNPDLLLQGSLDGNKIFKQTYPKGRLPQEIQEADLDMIYRLLFPRIAVILCKIPEILIDWELHAWTKNYKRLDDIFREIQELSRKIDRMTSGSGSHEDKVFYRIRKLMAQELGITMDITGLRGDRFYTENFDHYYVHPQISRQTKNAKIAIETEDDCFSSLVIKNSALVLTGTPGSGKTTWSTWLKRKALEQKSEFIPIRIELRHSIKKDLLPIQELVRKEANSNYKEDLSPELLRTWFSENRILFIFDGFDEIPPSERDSFILWIKNIYAGSDACPVVITSRPLTTDHLLNLPKPWQQWNIEPFDTNRITTYITQWYAHSLLLGNTDRSVNASAITQTWTEDPTIAPLTGNPLLLSTLLMVHHLDGELPAGRSELYKRYVKGMLGLWDTRRKVKGVDIELNPDQRYQVMRGIALQKHLLNKDALDDTEIYAITTAILKDLVKNRYSA